MYLKKPGFIPFSAESRGKAFEERIGVPNLAALRNIDADSVVRAAAIFPGVTGPIIDGYALVEHPALSLHNGHTHRVPLMLGSNGEEGTALYGSLRSPIVEIPPPVDTVEKYRAAIRGLFGSDAGRMLELYPTANLEEMLASSQELLGDSLFGAQAHYAARHFALAGRVSYLYFFTRKPACKAGEILGAFHSSEINYVFGTNTLGTLSKDDLKMSDAMMDYWVQFARAGDPSSPGRPRWTVFNLKQNQYMEFGTGSLYVTGDSIGLNYLADIGKPVVVTGIIRLKNGQPYIEIQRSVIR